MPPAPATSTAAIGQSDEFCGRRRADAVADLLEHHRIADGAGDVAQPRDRAREVGVALVLHRLLQRIGVHRKGIRADPVERVDQVRHDFVGKLRQSDVPDQQHVGRNVADREARRGRLVVEHDALRAEHHADAQFLGGRGQVAVDGAGQFGSARHRADQHGRIQTRAEELGVQVDCAEIGLGQRVVGQREALQAGGHRLVVDGLGQAHVDVLGLAGLHGVDRHRLPVLRQ